MKISEFISYLEKVKKEKGDINVCSSESNDYWGSLYNQLSMGYNLRIEDHAQTKGPKNSFTETIVAIGSM